MPISGNRDDVPKWLINCEFEKEFNDWRRCPRNITILSANSRYRRQDLVANEDGIESMNRPGANERQ